jgi:uncharacterized C2H2 Zn-finger protein
MIELYKKIFEKAYTDPKSKKIDWELVKIDTNIESIDKEFWRVKCPCCHHLFSISTAENRVPTHYSTMLDGSAWLKCPGSNHLLKT